ncbi:ABC transporter substrate-binding protein [Chloroflexi bacterium TSY]|nr:ABC transporter substrate-binding protein [Chloroflexi bacterium TSY]
MSDSKTARAFTRRQVLKGVAYTIASGSVLGALGGCQPSAAPAAPAAAPAAGPAADELLEEALNTGMLSALEPTPKRGGTLRWAGWFGARGFDPYVNLTRDVSSKTHSNLLRWNPMDGFKTVVPELALGYEKTEDGKQYTFNLRPGVKWHDGTDFTAEDVVTTYMRVVEPPEGLAMPNRSHLDFLAGVELIDPMTVRFELTEPRFYFPDLISYSAFPVLQKKALEENDMDLSTVYSPGTGPFVFGEYKSGESWTLTRNPDYWNPNLPYLDEVQLIHMTDWNARGTAILTGQAEFAQLTTVDMYNEGLQRSDVVGVSQHEGEHACVMFQINNENPPLDDPRVRRAIFLAVNRHNLLNAYAAGEFIGISSARWVADSTTAAMPADQIAQIPGYKQDNSEEIEMAKQLMADAGYADGFGPIEIVSGTNPNHSDVLAPAMQAELKKLNIDSTIRVIEVANRLTELQNGTFDMCIDVSFKSVTNDFVLAWAISIKSGGSRNFSRYSNPEFDDLVNQILTEEDEATRNELYAQGMDMLDENPPFYPLGFTKHNAIWRNELKGHFEDRRLFTVYGPPDTFWIDA